MRDIPYGATNSVDTWAHARKLKFMRQARCLHWLLSGDCDFSDCHTDVRPDWFDHVTGWTDDTGKKLLLCQPYGMNRKDLISLYKVCERHDLSVRITGGGWYGAGTVAIELAKKD